MTYHYHRVHWHWSRKVVCAGLMMSGCSPHAAAGLSWALSAGSMCWAPGGSSYFPLSCDMTLCVGTSCGGQGFLAWSVGPVLRAGQRQLKVIGDRLMSPRLLRPHCQNRPLKWGPRCQRKAQHQSHHRSASRAGPGRTHSGSPAARPEWPPQADCPRWRRLDSPESVKWIGKIIETEELQGGVTMTTPLPSMAVHYLNYVHCFFFISIYPYICLKRD